MLRLICAVYLQACKMAEVWLMPILVFLIRVSMARLFWYSGIVKITDWNTTLYLFEHEYNIPLLPPNIAACCATGIELVCPVLLVFGLATRFATIPTLIMVGAIEYTQPAEINLYWALLLSTILLYGPGYLSLDALIKKLILKPRQ